MPVDGLWRRASEVGVTILSGRRGSKKKRRD